MILYVPSVMAKSMTYPAATHVVQALAVEGDNLDGLTVDQLERREQAAGVRVRGDAPIGERAGGRSNDVDVSHTTLIPKGYKVGGRVRLYGRKPLGLSFCVDWHAPCK